MLLSMQWMYHFRFTHVQKIHFIENILKWMESSNVLNGQQCLILNFGSKRLFALPEITLSTEHKISLNIVTFGTKCTIVVIGGKFLKLIDEIMSMVHKITEHNDFTKITRAKDITYM